MEETEEEFVNKVVLYLQRYFKVDREVKSDCGERRIDLVITTKEGFRFGIECKRFNSKRGEEIGKYIKQAEIYAKTYFYGEKIPIFIAPPLSYKYFILAEHKQVIDNKCWYRDRHDENHEHHTINGLLGVFKIGEIRTFGSRVVFCFSNKIIWDSALKYKSNEIKGVHLENYKKLLEKIK